MLRCRVLVRGYGSIHHLTHARLKAFKRTFDDKKNPILIMHSQAHLQWYTLENASKQTLYFQKKRWKQVLWLLQTEASRRPRKASEFGLFRFDPQRVDHEIGLKKIFKIDHVQENFGNLEGSRTPPTVD